MTDPFGRDTGTQWRGERARVDLSSKIDPRITAGFAAGRSHHGVELLNDDETPMDFVVASLQKHLKLDRLAAIQAMLATHRQGRAVIAVPSSDEALRVSGLISADAKHTGYPLICRAISDSSGVQFD